MCRILNSRHSLISHFTPPECLISVIKFRKRT
jgi:hypothetical protein